MRQAQADRGTGVGIGDVQRAAVALQALADSEQAEAAQVSAESVATLEPAAGLEAGQLFALAARAAEEKVGLLSSYRDFSGQVRRNPETIQTAALINRDLEREVREGRFRADLFYRLSVFPLTLPPLRNRPEDIPLLVWHYIERRQAPLGRRIERVPERVMRALCAYSWPGNIRELENVLERALILSDGSTLATDPMFLEGRLDSEAASAGSLAEVERQYIIDVLQQCGWKVAGRGNAADRLGLNRSTLLSRMKKLGITRDDHDDRVRRRPEGEPLRHRAAPQAITPPRA